MAKKKTTKRVRRSRRNFVEASRRSCTLSDWSLFKKLPHDILRDYEVHEWNHASAVLQTDFSDELNDIITVLQGFQVVHEHIVVGGGRKTKLTSSIDSKFYARGWQEKRWDTEILLDGESRKSPTHAVDCVKNKVALEVEWSNKDPFYDRDLNNFRLLYDLRAISVGIIVTKSDELAALFSDLGIWSKYTTSTTWMSKLLPRIEGGGGGGCPLLVFGIRPHLYKGPSHD